MLFNSFEFLFFLPIVFLLYWFVFNHSMSKQNILILIASYIFYGWWSLKFLGLLVLITILDYLYGFGVASTNKNKSKFFLWLSVLNNIGILFVFKYYNFFINEFVDLFHLLGFHVNVSLINLVLPIGISFYTFHGMSYVFDIYNKIQNPIKSFTDYGVFVSFFPLLVAGPIERAGHLLPQIQNQRTFNYTQMVSGLRLILYGLFKKVVIADSLAPIADNFFNHYSTYNGVTLIFGAVIFSFQIYCDFSGYSDVALGTAKLFGFELLSNFKFPYFSRDLAEFWRRWHISLSSWFRDYLYIPLGGSKNGPLITFRNTLIIFLISGFWHGANWSFIAWGGIHALGFLPLLILKNNKKYVNDVVASGRNFPSMVEIFQMFITFSFVTFAWIFFRAESFAAGLLYLKQIGISLMSNPLQTPIGLNALLYIIPVVMIDWYLRNDERNLKVVKNKWIRYVLYFIMAFLVFNTMLGYNEKEAKNFIYFQF
jgi:alginate O-acetyltransferase complex protein AlgI